MSDPLPSYRYPFEAELEERQVVIAHRIARRVVDLGMTVPAILFLESVRPLNFVGSQVMVFFAPVVKGFLGVPEWEEFRLMLERREFIGYLCDLIEGEEEERRAQRERVTKVSTPPKASWWKRLFRSRAHPPR